MKSEVVIKNYLMSWFRPEKETELNTADKVRDPITDANYDAFMDIFVDKKGDLAFSENERKLVKEIITNKLTFATGYPLNASEKPKVGHIYITEGDFSEVSHYIGSRRLEGKTPTSIVVSGSTAGKDINLAEPSIIIKMISSLLWGGRNFFTAFHLEEARIDISTLEYDEDESHRVGYAMRSLLMTYKSELFSPITNFGVLEDG